MPVFTHRGCALHYDDSGSGPAILWVQGTGVGASGWGPQVAQFARDYRCLAFDNRGCGRSQPVGPVLDLQLMAEDALAVLDAAGVTSAHVVGHSLGGLIALTLALKAPDRVASLALLNTFASGSVPTRFAWDVLWIGARTRLGTRAMRRRAFVELVTPPDVVATGDVEALAARLGEVFERDLADSPPIAMRQVGAMRGHDVTPRLGELASIRTLVVSAAHDRLAPPFAGRAIAAGIPGSKYVEIADAAHAWPVQAAPQANALLAAHFRG